MSHYLGAGPMLLGVLAMMSGIVPSLGERALEDAVWCGGDVATIVGSDEADVLVGTSARDVIVGLGGDDVIDALAGNDIVCGGAGSDTIRGGRGADRLFGDAGTDVIYGGNGSDYIHGGTEGDKLHGGARDDYISGSGGNDKIYGGGGDDTLLGGAGGDRMRGRPGIDHLDGSVGRDNCKGETEHNCEIRHLGGRLDILNGPEVGAMPAGEDFHVWHGWGCSPIETDCAMEGAATVEFVLYVDGVLVEPSGLEMVTIVDEWRQKLWVYNFAGGMTDSHVFRAVWLEGGELSNERTVTIDFSLSYIKPNA